MPDEHDALTAFQLARRKGYRFSEQRWLESLKGERGDRGEKGERGDRGPRGLNGQNGKDGRSGRDGINGKDGRNGVDGQDGTLPAPIPWKATFERDANRLTKRMHIKAADGAAWTGNVLRDPFGAIAEVEFVPVTA
jgi:hypothetical protein